MYSETLVPTHTLSNMLRPNSSVPNQNPEGEDEDDDAARGDSGAVPLQPPPGVAPEAHRGTCDLLHIFGTPLYGLEEVGRKRDLPVARLHLLYSLFPATRMRGSIIP